MPATLAAASTGRLHSLSDTDFQQLMAGSPIRRIGVEHLRNNIDSSSCF